MHTCALGRRDWLLGDKFRGMLFRIYICGERARNACTAFVVIEPSNPRRPGLVILRPSWSALPPCGLASLQWWHFLGRASGLLLDLIVLVMTLPNVGAKNTFPAAACALCYLFCLINCWSPACSIIPPYPCRNWLLYFLVFTILNKQNLLGFMIW